MNSVTLKILRNNKKIIAVGQIQAVVTKVTQRLRNWLRVVHGSDGPAGRVGSGYDFSGFCRVGSALRIF